MIQLLPLILISSLFSYQDLSNACLPNLDGYNYICTFDLAKQKEQRSFPLTKGTSYRVELCSKNVDMLLQDYSRNIVSTSVVQGDESQMIVFKCEVGGIYYFTFTSQVPATNCPVVLAFKRD